MSARRRRCSRSLTLNNLDPARSHFEEVAAIFKDAQRQHGRSGRPTEAAVRLGDLEDSLERYQSALTICRRMKFNFALEFTTRSGQRGMYPCSTLHVHRPTLRIICSVPQRATAACTSSTNDEQGLCWTSQTASCALSLCKVNFKIAV